MAKDDEPDATLPTSTVQSTRKFSTESRPTGSRWMRRGWGGGFTQRSPAL
jgi:hypothetical protein